MSSEQHLDPLVTKQIKQSCTNVGIFAVGELRALFNQVTSDPKRRIAWANSSPM